MSPRVRTRRLHRVVRPTGGGPARKMNQRMVDRMFWRAGFGPTEADRQRWTGKSASSLVEYMLSAPQGLDGPAPTRADGTPLQPHANDRDMIMVWVDRMVRARNPFIERLTFFWHRHFATRRREVSPPQLMTIQNELFRRFSDFGSNPNATFTELMFQVGEDPAMLRFLTGEDNRARRVNENYAREVMELFCLGVTDRAGNPNYTEDDVRELSKALTGWQINDEDPDNAYGYFTEDRWESGPKTVLGRTANFKHRDAVEVVMRRPSHAPFLVTKLWHEFIETPPDRATMTDLTRAYLRSGRRLRPLMERILTHPLMFESLIEPNMVKPPIVYAAGLLRQLGLGVANDRAARALDAMGQVPYDPPTVAGWEGGLTWINTNSTLARFDLAQRLVSDERVAPEDVENETPAAAVDRAHRAVGRPWIAPGTRAALVRYAERASTQRERDRQIRQRALRAFMLGGPDAQVM